jgi:hypothetical protein
MLTFISKPGIIARADGCYCRLQYGQALFIAWRDRKGCRQTINRYSFDCFCGARSRRWTERKETAMHAAGVRGFLGGIKGSVVGAAVLLTWDALIGGTFMTSMLVCPIWFLVSLIQNAIERPGWDIALVRIGLPASLFGLVLVNNKFQLQVADARAQRVIAACVAYHAANGKFPEKLNELVPQYMPYVPSARYCPGPWSQFHYFNRGTTTLFWYVFPPYDRKIYTFDTKSWSYLN